LLASAGTLEIELDGTGTPGVAYDQLDVNGTASLNADAGTGGDLDLKLNFAASVGNSFTIVDNDGNDLIVGAFKNLPNLSTLVEEFGGNNYTFQISYAGGDGNDVALTVTNVAPAPAALEIAAVEVPIDEDHDALLL
jgi:hypothetical protein